MLGAYLGQGDRNSGDAYSVDAYVEAVSGWQETVTTYRTNLVPRLCSPKSKAYSKSPNAKLFIMNRTPSHCVSYALKTVSRTFYLPPVAVSLGRLSS